MQAALQQRLDALLRLDTQGYLARDPLRFPRRFSDPADQEIVGLLAAMLAYGRVELFAPVIEKILVLMAEQGGPTPFVDHFGPLEEEALQPILYRWNRHPDFSMLFRLMQRVRQDFGSIGAAFEPGPPKELLGGGIQRLRARVPLPMEQWSVGFRTWLPSPDDGSACKRWWLYLRWMVRQEAPDLGLWTHLHPSMLLTPVDTHVSRIGRLVGLTHRKDAGWRTAEEITASFAKLCPSDPVRYDFALAHLGISDGCAGHFVGEICSLCPLQAVCREGAG
ncbi:MAG TPA: TIGR02757 family protein [Myxococcota bacterium]|nr:TIGR02757 family protein [Myxococcota bacterium]HND30667.1 TIGR02757 family protein [Myxococcota bacterium]